MRFISREQSCEIDEIKLSISQQGERETIHYSTVDNEKKNHVRHNMNTWLLWTSENCECFVNSKQLYFTVLNLTFFRKLIKYFEHFCMKFALFFRFNDSWYIIKYLLTETSESNMFCDEEPASSRFAAPVRYPWNDCFVNKAL